MTSSDFIGLVVISCAFFREIQSGCPQPLISLKFHETPKENYASVDSTHYSEDSSMHLKLARCRL